MVSPTRNLPPDAEPWGRYIDTELDQLRFDAQKNAQDNANALSSINGTLAQLSGQIASIAKATADAASAAAAAGAAASQANSAIADLAARVSVTASIANFNTGTLPNDSTDHFYGPSIPITLAVPTGRLVVTIGCGQATVAAGSGAAIAEATFQIPGVVNYYDVYARMYNANTSYNAGSSMVVSRSFSMAPGTYTITGQMSAWAAGTGASINFAQPYMTVQVTG